VLETMVASGSQPMPRLFFNVKRQQQFRTFLNKPNPNG
jgi:hypothetical protein